MSLAQRWSDELEHLRGRGRLRSLRLPAGIDFTSNDYLGYGAGRLNAAGSGQQAAGRKDEEAVSSLPAACCLLPATALPVTGMSSRLLRGHHAVWDEVESALAAWHGADAVLMMTSGYAANEGLIATVIDPGDWVATDESNHASIIDALRLCRPRKFRFRHNDLNHLEDGLKTEAAKRPAGREMFVITESLFSMDGDRAPLRETVELAERHGAQVIVDEAHSTGCYGPAGSGCVDEAGLRGRVLATVHTGGKALGALGAYICGSRLLKEYLVNKCRHLIFTTALPPAVAPWWLDMVLRVRGDDEGRGLLHANTAAFRAALGDHGVRAIGTDYVVPIVFGDDERAVCVASRLKDRGFDVRAIRPPSVPPGSARIRISIHADHDPATLARLAAAVGEASRP
jgi:8-amino-7-oxononanoate synthase